MVNTDKQYILHFQWHGKEYKVNDAKDFNTLQEAKHAKAKLSAIYLEAFNANDNNQYRPETLYAKARKLAKDRNQIFNIRISKKK